MIKRYLSFDVVLGFVLAGGTACVGTFLQWATHSFGIQAIEDKILLIACVFLGASTFPPLIKGIQFNGLSGKPKKLSMFMVSSFAGILASGYFIAIVGFNLAPGIGAGLSEVIDSGMSPFFYLSITAMMGVVGFSRQSIIGAACLLSAMLLLLLDVHADSVQKVTQTGVSIPMLTLFGLSLLGALGTATSTWVLRRLVRSHGVSVGGVLLFRYGAPALVFLGLWLGLSKNHQIESALWIPLVLGYCVGAFVISLVFFVTTRIHSDVITAASTAMIPTFSVLAELSIGHFIPGYTILATGDWMLPVVLVLTAVGILFLNFDPASSKA